jgi:hypothetical protein
MRGTVPASRFRALLSVAAEALPFPGEAFFYLVRPVTASGPASYDSAGPGQIEGRDLEIAASGHGCP